MQPNLFCCALKMILRMRNEHIICTTHSVCALYVFFYLPEYLFYGACSTGILVYQNAYTYFFVFQKYVLFIAIPKYLSSKLLIVLPKYVPFHWSTIILSAKILCSITEYLVVCADLPPAGVPLHEQQRLG